MKKLTTYENIFSSLAAGHVLDVATGRGGFINILDQTLQSYDEIIGVDTVEGIETFFAENFAGKPIHYQQMDAYRLAFDDASFDTVVIANSLHHLNSPLSVLAEMQRVLKPGGRFIISEMFRDGLTEPQETHVLLHHWWAAIDSATGIVHNETYGKAQLMAFANEMDIAGWAFHDVAYFDEAPKDEATIKQLEGIIDRYVQRAESLPEQNPKLVEEGQALRRRVREVGFHGATTLVAIGVK